MRNNGPVTQKEVELSPNDQLVSSTNAKGVILEANDDFCRLAGFTREELIGQAHNIVRHSDMPQAAFQLLWDTVNQGRPWRGIVKNRCKNGDHYWVDAYVTPVYENGEIASLESVRQKAKPEWIARAETLYRRLNAGQKPFSAGQLWLARNTAYVFAGGLGIIFTLFGWLISGLGGAAMGILVLAALVFMARSSGTAQEISKHLNNFHSDEITQYIYTGKLHTNGKLSLLEMFHNRHLHTVVERMDQLGKTLQMKAVGSYERAEQQSQAIDKEKQQLDNVASAVTEMSHSIQEIADNAEQSSELSKQARDIAKEGMDQLSASSSEIDRLVTTMNQTEKSVSELAAGSEEIRSVVGVISGIAEQTNLLALNAAIEAARAGEQGRGFAVVADEVRSLASKTQESTETIANIINQLVSTTQQTVDAIGKGASISKSSQAAITESKEQIQNVSNIIQDVNEKTLTIAELSGQQAIASNEIGQNTEGLTTITDELHQLSSKSLEFSEELVDQAKQQGVIIRRFRRGS